jgi:hypothetical protein
VLCLALVILQLLAGVLVENENEELPEKKVDDIFNPPFTVFWGSLATALGLISAWLPKVRDDWLIMLAAGRATPLAACLDSCWAWVFTFIAVVWKDVSIEIQKF